MTFRGKVSNGVVVLEPGTQLREGADVRVEVLSDSDTPVPVSPDLERLRADLLAFSGIIKDGPADLAHNHDHYLHGTERR
jgi:hypothetical protein